MDSCHSTHKLKYLQSMPGCGSPSLWPQELAGDYPVERLHTITCVTDTSGLLPSRGRHEMQVPACRTTNHKVGRRNDNGGNECRSRLDVRCIGKPNQRGGMNERTSVSKCPSDEGAIRGNSGKIPTVGGYRTFIADVIEPYVNISIKTLAT